MTDAEILQEAKDKVKYYFDVFYKYRAEARDDMDFINGDQWTDDAKRKRRNRPMEVVNDAKIDKRRTIEDYNQRTSSVKIKAKRAGTPKKTVIAYQGIINGIKRDSLVEYVQDNAMDDMLSCGMGFYYLDTEFEDDDMAYNQVITVEQIDDPFMAFYDPDTKKIDYTDIEWGGWLEIYSTDGFKLEFPDKDLGSFPSIDRFSVNNLKSGVIVCKYYRIHRENDTLVSVADPREPGKSFEFHLSEINKVPFEIFSHWEKMAEKFGEDFDTESPYTWLLKTERVLKKRHFERKKVKWYRFNNSQLLDKGDWAGSYIPLIPMLGSKYKLHGHTYFDSLIREKKPPARMYNYVISNILEYLATAPIASFTSDYRKIKGFEHIWSSANNNPNMVLPYRTVTDKNGQTDWSPPMRLTAADVPGGWTQAGMIAQENKSRTSGITDSALGLKGNEVSGDALEVRTQNSLANRSVFFKARQFNQILYGKQVIDLIPKIHDGQRMQEIVKEDGTSQVALINKEKHEEGDGEFKGEFIDIKNSKFGVFVSVGPSYDSQKQETATKTREVMAMTPPEYMAAVYPHFIKNLDMLNADEMVEDIKKLAPPALQDKEQQDENQLRTENEQIKQENEQLKSINDEMEKVINGETTKVQSQEKQTQAKIKADIAKETIKQNGETERERMSNRTDIVEAEIQAQSRKEIELLKQSMGDMSSKMDLIVKAITTNQSET